MIIDLTDPRFADAGLHIAAGQTDATIHDVDGDGNALPSVKARVAVKDGKLAFQPVRSSAQRKVLARIGVSVPEPSFP